MPTRSPSEKAADKFFSATDALNFDITTYTHTFRRMSAPERYRFLSIFSALIEDMASYHDCGLAKNPAEQSLYAEAAVVRNAIRAQWDEEDF